MKKDILGIILIASFALFSFSCSNNDGGNGGPYIIGDTGPSGVGKVFYVTDDRLHGLEAAPMQWNGGIADPEVTWSDVTGALVGGTMQTMGTGFANSNAIIAQFGHTASAAKMCRDYNGGGKDDWFLP